MRSFIQIYALTVCFTTLMCFVVALGIGLYDLIQVVAPNFTMNYHQIYQSNDSYAQYYLSNKELPASEVTQLREQAFRGAIEVERRSALQSLVFVSIIATIDLVVFITHWRIARIENKRAEEQLAS